MLPANQPRPSELPTPSVDFPAERIGRDKRGLPCLAPGRGLTKAERGRLVAQRSAIEVWLTPAQTEEIGGLLVTPLLAVRVARSEGELGDMVVAEYAEALGGLPAAAMKAARRAINRDEVPGIDRKFMPTPSELAHSVKLFAAKAQFERRWIDRILSLSEAAPEPPEARVAVEAHRHRLGVVRRRGNQIALAGAVLSR